MRLHVIDLANIEHVIRFPSTIAIISGMIVLVKVQHITGRISKLFKQEHI